MTPKHLSALIRLAREVNATNFQVQCAAILVGVHGLQYALEYLDACRIHFETVAQVRVFLHGRRWSRRYVRQIKVTHKPGSAKFVLQADSDKTRYALRQLFANTNVEVGE